MWRGGFGTFCLALTIACVSFQKVNSYVNLNETGRHESLGRLTPGCVQQYHDLIVSRNVPKRRYRYFNEQKDFMDAKKQSDVEVQWRIVGGQQVDISLAPYVVLYGLHCGGCLIAPNWALTAAHCKTKDDFVVAGSTKASDGIHYHICAHFLHPEWDNPNKNHFHDYDYQLLLLEKPVPVTLHARPIAIGETRDVVPGAMVSIAGWGHTQMKQRGMQNILRQVAVPIIPSEDCMALPHNYYTTITPRMFCAGSHNGTKDSCQGDSGGPGVVNDKLVGLVSFGVGCAEKDKPGVYSNVPYVRPWIREVTGLPL